MFKKLSLTVISSLVIIVLAVPVLAATTVVPTRHPLPTPKVKAQVLSIYKDPGDGSALVSKNGNVYVANNDVAINDDIHGDLVAAGGTVIVKGHISGNVYAAGGGVEIDNDVNGDLTVFGGSIIVNGTVRGDIRIAGGEVFINSPRVGGDLIIAAGKTLIAQGVKVTGLDKIAGEGDRTMSVVRDAKNNPTKLSQTSFKKTTTQPSASTNVVNILVDVFFSLMLFFGSIIAAYLVLRLFPIFSETTLTEMRHDPLKSLLVGGISLFVYLITVVFLALSIVGWPVLALSGLFAIVAYYIAGFYANYSIGRFILVQLKHQHTGRFFPLVLGMVLVAFVMWVFDFIPLLGALINFVIGATLVSWGVGAMVVNKYRALRKH